MRHPTIRHMTSMPSMQSYLHRKRKMRDNKEYRFHSTSLSTYLSTPYIPYTPHIPYLINRPPRLSITSLSNTDFEFFVQQANKLNQDRCIGHCPIVYLLELLTYFPSCFQPITLHSILHPYFTCLTIHAPSKSQPSPLKPAILQPR